MVEIIERRIGETGNPIRCILENDDDDLTIPDGASVTLSGVDTITGTAVIDDADCTIVDQATREVRYDFADADLATGRELELTFAIVPDDAKPTYVPDKRTNRLRLIIW